MNDEPESGLNLLQKGLQQALIKRGVTPIHYQRSDLARKAARLLGRAGLIRPLSRSRAGRVIVPVVWASHATLFAATYFHEVVPWIFDCWEPQFDAWERLLRLHRVKTAFFSARIAATEFERRIPGLKTHWMPEACDPNRYTPSKPLHLRSTHVLEMGRKHDATHAAILAALKAGSYRHIYSTPQSPSPMATIS
jgi:hypothetical protein